MPQVGDTTGSSGALLQRQGRTGRVHPFDETGVYRRSDGVLDYRDSPDSLTAVLCEVGKEFPTRTALAEVGGASMTYADLISLVTTVAGGLRRAKLNRGDRVAIMMDNGIPWVAAFLGVIFAGCVAVPINTRFTDPEVDYVVSDCGASMVLSESTGLPSGPPWVDLSVGSEDLAVVFYTSGTTGFPKGAMATHRNLLSITETIRRLNGSSVVRPFRTLLSVPLFHVTGCNGQLLPTLEVAGEVQILGRFTVERFIGAIDSAKPSQIVGVPAIYAMTIGHPSFQHMDVSHVERVMYGGAPMPPDLIARLRRAFPRAQLSNGFGLTETSSVVTRLPDEWCDSHPDSVGFATPVVELDLLDPDEHDAGELLVRSPGVVSGYWGQPELSSRVIVDGWLKTGDVATIDRDGLCRIVDRRKDVIVRGGENVYSVEVENSIAAIPGVAEAAVVGVPDDVMGERVGAVLVLDEGIALDSDALLSTLRKQLAPFKLPEYLVWSREPLPRNPGGKVLKAVIRKDTDWGPRIRRAPA